MILFLSNSASSSVIVPRRTTRPGDAGAAVIVSCLFRPLHALLAEPSLLFILTLAVMLFRPPDVQFYSLDRVALLILVLAVVLRTLASKQPLWIPSRVTIPLLGLVLIAFCSVWVEPYATENWSLFAAKWAVPLILYLLAGLVFTDTVSIRRFEMFALVVLAYLALTAIFFLLDARWLIYPRYILNENIGIHADRARGPFLQAVANGVALNLLGLLALDSFRRYKLRGMFAFMFMLALPIAVLATRTRAIWATFAGAVLLLLFLVRNSRVRRACFVTIMFTAISAGGCLLLGNPNTSLNQRLQERSPVEFRMDMYLAGWQMFLAKPIGDGTPILSSPS